MAFAPGAAEEERNWVSNKAKILRRYLAGPALPDIVSTIPYDLLILLESNGPFSNERTARGQTPLASAAGLCEPLTSPAVLPPPQSSRILRILRLLKVTRLLRHQLLRRMEDSWGLNHGYVALAKFSAGTLLLAHWMGCALALVRGPVRRLPQRQRTRWTHMCTA